MKKLLSVFIAASLLLPLLSEARPDLCKRAKAENRPCVGLVLSGGGARGLSHIGVLKALEELHVPVDIITGTSMGSLVGGSYAIGYPADKIEKLARSINWAQMFRMDPDRALETWNRKENDQKNLRNMEIGINANGISIPSGVVPSQELNIFLSHVTEPARSISDLTELAIPFAAMATNLETGERVVLEKNITLQQAMRASMSVPGAFFPVEYNGKMLVDGGLTDNLPIAYARQMGAQKIIAVNVGTPPGDKSSFTNILGVMAQMVTILTEQNVRRSLKDKRADDLLIEPDLTQYTSTDFDKIGELISTGYSAAIAQKSKLKKFAVPQKTYLAWEHANRLAASAPYPRKLAGIEVKGVTERQASILLDKTDLKDAANVTEEQVADASRKMWALGDYTEVPYHFERHPDSSETLIFTPEIKPQGDSVLRFGGSIETDFTSTSTFNTLASYSLRNVLTEGTAWTTDIQIGNERKLLTEFLYPLGDEGNWFIKPYVSYSNLPFNIYEWHTTSERHPKARLRYEALDAAVRLGTSISSYGVAWTEAGWRREKAKTEISLYEVSLFSERNPYIRAGFTIDTLDNANFPKNGVYATAEYQHRFSYEGNGSRKFYYGRLLYPVSYKDWVAHVELEAGRTTDSGYMSLGGVFRLSGSPKGRFNGNHLIFGRLMLAQNVSDFLTKINMPVYIGATYEMGRIYDPSLSVFGMDKKDWIKAASGFAAFDSWIGPIYLVAGRTFGHSSALTLYWGKLY